MSVKTMVFDADMSKLEQKLADITQKMKNAQNSFKYSNQMQSNATGAGLPQQPPHVQKAFQDSFKQHQTMLTQEYTKQSALLSDSAKKYNEINAALTLQKNLREAALKSGLNTLQIDEDILKTQKQQSVELEKLEKLKESAAKAATGAATGAGVGGFGGGGGGGGGASTLSATMNVIKNTGIILAITEALKLGVSAWANDKGRAISNVVSQGNAATGMYGSDIEARYNGRSGLEGSLVNEKLQALAMARKKQSLREYESIFSMDWVKEQFGSKSAQRSRQITLAENLVEDRNSALQGIIKKDPEKNAAREHYYASARPSLEFQRQMGLNYESFHGINGFNQSAANSGFDPELAKTMASQIMGAGGSSGTGTGNAIFGLQAQRNFNITNAGSILGKLGSVNGNQSDNKEAFIRILAEGTKLGFDGSHYVEESRKFTETVSEIIAKNGGNAEDASRLAKGLSSFVADPTTTAGIQGSKSAYEKFQEITSSTEGWRGSQHAAALYSGKFKNLNQMTRINLAGMSEDEMTEDNPLAVKAFRESGFKTFEDFHNAVKGIDTNLLTRPGQNVDGLKKKLQNYESKTGNVVGPSNFGKTGEGGQFYMDIAEEVRAANPSFGKQEVASAVNKIMGREQMGPSVPTEFLKKQMESNGDTGKVEDRTEAANALAAKEMLNAFRESKDALIPTTEALQNYNKALSENLRILKETGIVEYQKPTGESSQQKRFRQAPTAIGEGQSAQAQPQAGRGRVT